jgi:hypothetical protein
MAPKLKSLKYKHMFMKVKLSVLMACVLFAQAAMAQLHFGVKGGANLTKIEGKAFSDQFNTGYNLGAFAEIGFGKLSIQPEVLFNQVKTTVDSSFKQVYQGAADFSSYKDIKLNYLSIPILLDYKLAPFLSLQAGPQFGILINQNKNLVENGKNAFKSGDFSLLGGAQLNISKIRVTGRYFVGLSNVNDLGNQNKWKNQGWQLSVGFAIL